MKSENIKGYNWYMASPAWSQKKAQYRDSGRDCRCCVCKDSKVQFHHRTYTRFMNEALDDLVPLCEDHHNDLHLFQREKMLSVETATDRYLRSRGKKVNAPLSPEDRAYFQYKERARKAKAKKWTSDAEEGKQRREEAVRRQIALGLEPVDFDLVGAPQRTQEGLIRSCGTYPLMQKNGRRRKRRR